MKLVSVSSFAEKTMNMENKCLICKNRTNEMVKDGAIDLKMAIVL